MLRQICIDIHLGYRLAVGGPCGYAVDLYFAASYFWEVFAFFAVVCECALDRGGLC